MNKRCKTECVKLQFSDFRVIFARTLEGLLQMTQDPRIALLINPRGLSVMLGDKIKRYLTRQTLEFDRFPKKIIQRSIFSDFFYCLSNNLETEEACIYFYNLTLPLLLRIAQSAISIMTNGNLVDRGGSEEQT